MNMKKKILTITSVILLSLTALFVLVIFLSQKYNGDVLYPRFDAPLHVVILIFSLLFLDAVVLFAVWLCLTKKLDRIIIAVLLCIIFIPGTLIVTYTFSWLPMYYSATEELQPLDPDVNETLDSLGLDSEKLLFVYADDEITEYSYEYYPLSDNFRIELSVSLSEERFDEIIAGLAKNSVLQRNGTDAVGNFKVNHIYNYLNRWNETLISYDNDKNTISYVISYRY